MSAINFKEIPQAHLGGGLQDTFELFARDFLSHLGYKIEEDPSRGADGGKDILVIERRIGVGGETAVRWLVSCKHNAHSGSSVSAQDDSNISDRINAHGCNGFIGFYSTLASSGLSDNLKGLSKKFEIQIFDREKIESNLLKTPGGVHLARRYFPKSIAAWSTEKRSPTEVFKTHPTLYCKLCRKNLLEPEPSGIIVVWHKYDPASKKTHYNEVYWCCKGNCDEALSRSMSEKDYIDGWEDIQDIAIPLVFARWMMTPLNRLNSGDTYSPSAFSNLKKFILSIYPFVARDTTKEEQDRVNNPTQTLNHLGRIWY